MGQFLEFFQNHHLKPNERKKGKQKSDFLLRPQIKVRYLQNLLQAGENTRFSFAIMINQKRCFEKDKGLKQDRFDLFIFPDP